MRNSSRWRRLNRYGISTCLLLVPLCAAAQWQSTSRSADKSAHLYAANALFKAKTQNRFSTLSALAQLQTQPSKYASRAALLFAAVGLPQQAEASMLAAPISADTSSVWLTIAQTYYDSGDFAATERVLVRMPPQSLSPVAQQRASLLGRTLLRQKRYDEAALPLAATQQFGQLAPIDQYNLGIAWLGAGAEARGAGELNAIGRYVGDDATQRALAHQANLSLGYWLLNQQSPRQARSVLWRIPLNSAVTRKALLALGWAEFLDTEAEQPLIETAKPECNSEPSDLWQNAEPLHKVPRNNCRVPKVEQRAELLAAAPGYAQAANQYERAAVAWQAAIDGGNARNPVVAEALIALPYALVKAGDLARAQTAYQRAINLLLAAERELAQPESAGLKLASQRGAQLAAIEAGLLQMRKHIETRVAQLIAAPQNHNARDVANILQNLRNSSSDGRKLAHPSAVERGRLLLALSSPQSSAVTQRLDQMLEENSQAALQQRVIALQLRIVQALSSVGTQRAELQKQTALKRRKHIRSYLRQAALAFADLAQDTSAPP